MAVQRLRTFVESEHAQDPGRLCERDAAGSLADMKTDNLQDLPLQASSAFGQGRSRVLSPAPFRSKVHVS